MGLTYWTLATVLSLGKIVGMSDYRRFFVPGGTYFFTLVTERRTPLFTTDWTRETLGCVIRRCREQWPFNVIAVVLLSDHLHALCALPPGDDRYSMRLNWIKGEFTKAFLGHTQRRSHGCRRRYRRCGS
jgi:putative transposase